MRILVLSQYYAPEPIPKPVDLAVALARRGHDVTVLTGFPNYPSGRLYDGYRLRPMRREIIDGVPVVRAFELPYHGRSALGRLANYGSFMLAAPLASTRLGRFDVIYVWHPPLTMGVAAWLVSLITRAPFAYDVQDIWPDAAVLSGLLRPGVFVRLLSRLERFVYRRAAHLFVATDAARTNLLDKGVPPDRVTTMSHWVDEALLTDRTGSAEAADLRRRCGWEDRFVVMFAGNLGLVQGLDTVLQAAARLRDTDVHLVFVGDGVDRPRLIAMTTDLDLRDRVTFIDRQSPEALSAYHAAADALVVHLRRSPLSDFVIPLKTASYLAAGRPIVAATGGAAGELVERAGAGCAVSPDDPEALAAVLRRLRALPADERAAMGDRGRAFARARLAAGVVVPQYEAELARIASVHADDGARS
jgi:colanic acid biosynthesis glycosyl transferase WcaI